MEGNNFQPATINGFMCRDQCEGKSAFSKVQCDSRQPSFIPFGVQSPKKHFGFGSGNVEQRGFGFGVAPKVKGFGSGNVSPLQAKEKFGFVTLNNQEQPSTVNWFQTKEQSLENQIKKLHEEIKSLKETSLKEKNELLEKLDRKNDLIIDLTEKLRNYHS